MSLTVLTKKKQSNWEEYGKCRMEYVLICLFFLGNFTCLHKTDNFVIVSMFSSHKVENGAVFFTFYYQQYIKY